MRIIVVGASRFGVATLNQLIEAGHEPILVERRRERIDEIADEIDCGFIHGDGTFPSILREAMGDGADALLMLTNHEEANIVGAAIGRSIGIDRVVVQIVRTELVAICTELGLDEVITPHETVARSIVTSLEHGDDTKRRSEIDVSGDTED